MTPSTVYTGSSCVVGLDVSAQPPWSIATSTKTELSFIVGSISRVMSFGASAPGMRTAPIVRSGVLDRLLELERRRHEELHAPAQDLLEVAHAIDRALENRHLRSHAERDDRGVVADHPAADHEHARRAPLRRRRRGGSRDRPSASRAGPRPPAPRGDRRSRSSARAAGSAPRSVSTVS